MTLDLFAGVGGFHAALSAFGVECFYAVEIDKRAANVYEANWGQRPEGDIRDTPWRHSLMNWGHDPAKD